MLTDFSPPHFVKKKKKLEKRQKPLYLSQVVLPVRGR